VLDHDDGDLPPLPVRTGDGARREPQRWPVAGAPAPAPAEALRAEIEARL
jgi:hypothetical protein